MPQPKWRIVNVLPETGLGVLYGPPGSGKSFLALDLALALTQGNKHWFGAEITGPCSVLYVNLESSWGLQGRLRAWTNETGEALPSTLSFIIDPFDLLDEGHIGKLIQRAPKNGVIIIDTLARATPGTDENSSVDMGLIIQATGRIQAATASLVLLVTHSGKDATRGVRGHTSLTGAADAVIELTKREKSRVLKLVKAKEAEDGIQKEFVLKPVIIDHDKEKKGEFSPKQR